jgi:hypothetical protein
MPGQLLKPPKTFFAAPSATIDIVVAHGSDWNDCFQLRQSGQPMDLTGMQVQVDVGTEHESDIRFLDIGSGAGSYVFIEDIIQGKVQIFYPHYLVDLIPCGDWRVHARLLADGERREIFRGRFTVLPAEYSA